MGGAKRHCIYSVGLVSLCIMWFLKNAVIVKLTYVVDIAYINEMILMFSCAVTFACCFHSYYLFTFLISFGLPKGLTLYLLNYALYSFIMFFIICILCQ